MTQESRVLDQTDQDRIEKANEALKVNIAKNEALKEDVTKPERKTDDSAYKKNLAKVGDSYKLNPKQKFTSPMSIGVQERKKAGYFGRTKKEIEASRVEVIPLSEAERLEANKLLDTIVGDNMPTMEEMRTDSPGVCQRHLDWVKRNKSSERRYSELRERDKATKDENYLPSIESRRRIK